MAVATSQFRQNWDLDSLLPPPANEEFPRVVEAYRRDLAALAERSDRLPGVGDREAAAWGAFLREYERLEMQATDLSAFIGCHAAADAANKLYRQFEAALSALDPLRERIATNLEFALRDASDAEFEAAGRRPIRRFRKTPSFCCSAARTRGCGCRAARNCWRPIWRWTGSTPGAGSTTGCRASCGSSVMEKGEIVEKSPGQIRFDSPERSVRQNNFYAADKAWKIGRRQLRRCAQSHCRHAADAVPAAGAGGPSGSAAAQEPDATRDAGDDVVGHHAAQGSLAEVSVGQGAAAGAGAAGVVRHAGAAARD